MSELPLANNTKAQKAARTPNALSRALFEIADKENRRFFLWVPVCFGTGIAVYFFLPKEPSLQPVIAAVLLAGILFVFSRSHFLIAPICAAVFLAVLGFADAMLRTHLAAAPVIEKESRLVEVTGWLERVIPRAKGERLLIRPTNITKLPKDAWPYRLRLQNNVKGGTFRPGDAVKLKAILRPLPEPVRPQGFDFARRAWFQRIGGVGYTIAAPEQLNLAGPPPWDLALNSRVEILRQALSNRIRASLPGPAGATADALITGNRGGITEAHLESLRQSGLAHILAISGLHMALMAGALFWLLRAGLALSAPLTLSIPIKKWAAVLALGGGLFYLLISGSSLSAIRAFVMIAIMFTAVLMDRRALSLRNVALAAMTILLLWPEALFDVSFQMSFAAVTALIAYYEWSLARKEKDSAGSTGRTHVLQRLPLSLFRYLRGLATTTIVASIAIAPFAAFHFHRLAEFGLIANIAAMPIVALIIMPAALLSLLAMPFGLEAFPLAAMGQGIGWVFAIADHVRSISGAVRAVPAIPGWSLGLITLGGLWLLLWRTNWRYGGLALIAAGVVTAAFHEAPDILIERDAKTFAIRATDGTLSAPKRRGGLYSLEQWLRADGDLRSVAQAQNGNGYRCDRLGCIARVKEKLVSFILHPAALEEDCTLGDVIIITWPLFRPCSQSALIIDKRALTQKGAHALYIEKEKIKVETAADFRGVRPWSATNR